MKEITRLLVSLLATVILLFVGVFYHKKIEHSFLLAVNVFSFNVLGPFPTMLFLLTISIALPITAMIILFNQVHSASESRQNFISNCVLKHIYFGYLLMCMIYTIDILYDCGYPNTDVKRPTNYNEWHKYILHFIIGPVLFLDAIYSIEIEKIRSDEDIEAKRFEPIYYYGAQLFFTAYLLYIFAVILFLDGNRSFMISPSIPTISDLNKASEILGYVGYLVNDIILCVFVALFMGLLDQNVSPVRALMIFEVYTDWTHKKVSKYATRFRRHPRQQIVS